MFKYFHVDLPHHDIESNYTSMKGPKQKLHIEYNHGSMKGPKRENHI